MKKALLIYLVLALTLPMVLIAGCKSSAPSNTSKMEVATTFVFTKQPTGAAPGKAFTTQPVVAVTDPYGNVILGYTGAITLAITHGTGASGAKLSGKITVDVSGGTATFTDLSIDIVGSGYSLTATSGSLIPTSSKNFDVAVPTPPTKT
ncbi:MAG: hypothetical protein C4542_09195 [Dehalococcoidia bacterium]|nr:MAG: hypothetical protein C4542_09195 [Dehalococcoidia bacterium]